LYLTILILPIIGSIISGILGRKIGREGSEIITSSCMGIALILSIIAYYEIGYNNS
jgi:NADH-ubiquinone oxidoreductase chain 5